MELDKNIMQAINNRHKLDNIAQTMHDTEQSLMPARSPMAQAYIHAHAALLYTLDWMEANAQEMIPKDTLHSAPCTLHSEPSTPHSALCTPHSEPCTQPSALKTQPSLLPTLRCLEFTAYSKAMLDQLHSVKAAATILGVKTI